MTDAVIKLDLDGEGGAKIRRLFAAAADVEPVLQDFGEYKRRRVVLSMKRLPRNTRSTPGEPPAKRTTMLAQRITYDVQDKTVLDVGTNDVRARMLHFGGIQRPRNAKALTVPVHPDAVGRRAKDFDNLVFIRRKGQAPLLVRKKYTGGKNKKEKSWDVMFVLLKAVTIPPHPFLVWHDADRKYLLLSLKRSFENAS